MQSVITNSGINLLNQTRADGTVQYWLGYFGLAYVPDEQREISPSMTSLAPDGGDVIYNLFQGGMTPSGFNTDIGDSLASSLYGQCLYTGSVISNYRYVLDENDANQLVVFAKYEPKNAENPVGMYEYYRFTGVGSEEPVDLPVPAPLYYTGEPRPYDNLPSYADENVSCDTRIYQSNNAETRGPITDPTVMGQYDYADSLDNTYDNDGMLTQLDKDWQFQSVSNFNRFHAPASFSGYAVNQDPACRNMAKATKYFPISHYDVISTKDETTVSQVKYTISLDMASVFAKVSNRTTKYYKNDSESETDEEIPYSNYKFGFKFNRIGIYAVPVTLHAYNTLEDSDGNCTEQNVQMQISGNEEPILFAVMDFPAPIVMKEDEVNKYEINFQLDFGEEGQVVNSSAIYYNLYESDAITWYKNQLIANASAANAITDMGVQINYLRKQLNDALLTPSYCGIGDTGDEIGVGYTGLKNLVDTAVMANGGVRGIYTEPEHLGDGKKIVSYKRDGRTLIEDPETGKIVYEDEPTVEATPLFEIEHYTLGEYSMGLGHDSVTSGKFNINLSNYGILSDNTQGVLLMGGFGKEDGKLDYNRQLSVHNAGFSIINLLCGEFENINASMFLDGSYPTSTHPSNTIHRATNTIGLGINNVTDGNPLTASLEKTITGEITKGIVDSSILLSSNDVYGTLAFSFVTNCQNVSVYDAMADVNLLGFTDADVTLTTMFTSPANPDTSILSLGSGNSIGRGVTHVLAATNSSTLPTGSSNLIMLGDNQNNFTGIYNKLVLTVDQFNKRYGTVDPSDNLVHEYPSDDPIYQEPGGVFVIGDGDLYGKGSGFGPRERTLIKPCRGATLYISYHGPDHPMLPNTWSTGPTCGDLTEISAYQYGRLYTSPGHYKNMIMLGDNQLAGWGSENSVIMGDYSGSAKITFKNSFINFLGDRNPFNQIPTTGPNATFDNVWWIGNATPSQDEISFAGNSAPPAHVGAYTCGSEYYGVIKNKFVFTSDNSKVYGHAYWYGVEYIYGSYDLTGSENNSTNAPLYDGKLFSESLFNVPMMYTGGIALGGYGDHNCNFMLMKIGTSRGDTMNINSYGINDGNNCYGVSYGYSDRFNKLIRSTDLWFSDNKITSIDIYQKVNTRYDTTNDSDMATYTLPSNHSVVTSKEIKMAINNGSSEELLNITGVTDTYITASRAGGGQIPANTRINVSYTYINKDGRTLYDYCRSEEEGHHFMVDSPYAGMVLMVQDKQELDGTLHIGLGKPKSIGGGFNTNDAVTIRVRTHYIQPAMRFEVSVCTATSMTTYQLQMEDPHHENHDSYEDGREDYSAISSSPDGFISVQGKYRVKRGSSVKDQLLSVHVEIDPQNHPIIFECESDISSFPDLDYTYTSRYFAVHGITENKGQLVSLNIGSTWFNKAGNDQFIFQFPMVQYRSYAETEFTEQRKLNVNYDAINLPDDSTILMLTPLEMPGYYYGEGYNYPDIMKTDHAYVPLNSIAPFSSADRSGAYPYTYYSQPTNVNILY